MTESPLTQRTPLKIAAERQERFRKEQVWQVLWNNFRMLCYRCGGWHTGAEGCCSAIERPKPDITSIIRETVEAERARR